MKKIVVLAVVVLSLAALNVFAGDVTPIKASLMPKLSLPSHPIVHGLDIALIASQPEEVQGVQLGFIYGGAAEKMVGIQSSFVNEAGSMDGLQWGFYNGSKNVRGIQVGFINVAESMQGIQFGLINVIKKGIVPVMVVLNANF